MTAQQIGVKSGPRSVFYFNSMGSPLIWKKEGLLISLGFFFMESAVPSPTPFRPFLGFATGHFNLNHLKPNLIQP